MPTSIHTTILTLRPVKFLLLRRGPLKNVVHMFRGQKMETCALGGAVGGCNGACRGLRISCRKCKPRPVPRAAYPLHTRRWAAIPCDTAPLGAACTSASTPAGNADREDGNAADYCRHSCIWFPIRCAVSSDQQRAARRHRKRHVRSSHRDEGKGAK